MVQSAPEPSLFGAAKKMAPKLLAGAATLIAADAIADQISPEKVTKEVVYVPSQTAPVPAFTPSVAAVSDKIEPDNQVVPFQGGSRIASLMRGMREQGLNPNNYFQNLPQPMFPINSDFPEVKVAAANDHSSTYTIGALTVSVALFIIASIIYYFNRHRNAKPQHVPLQTVTYAQCSSDKAKK